MLKIEREERKLVSLGSIAPGTLSERYDLREFIFNSPDAFFGELGEKLFVIARDVRPSDQTPTRIDLLALDRAGNAVVVLLPLGREASPLSRALACASFISDWKPGDFFEGMSEKRVGDLVTSLDVNLDEINRRQRAVLIAEAHDAETLTAARWLRERFGIEVACVQVSLALDSRTNAEFLLLTDVAKPASAGLQAFEAVEAEPASRAAERRKHARTRRYRADHLKLDYAGRALGAKLVDYSEGGLGVEMLGPLPLGSTVSVSGELHSADSSIDLEGTTRVAHCQYPEDSVFRIGLAFGKVQLRDSAGSESEGGSGEGPAPA